MVQRCLPSLDPDSSLGKKPRLTLDDRSTPIINVGRLLQFGPFANVLQEGASIPLLISTEFGLFCVCLEKKEMLSLP